MSPISTSGKVTLAQTQVFPDDLDAVTYVLAVEAVDGQTLEPDVRLAYNTFIKGCKTDGIWDAIKSSCILAGARTLAGALVPLKGTAPTNFNFVSGDYNRETGLVGNGSTKYLNSNRNNNADPQNSQHLSCYASTLGTSAAVTMLTTISVAGASHIGLSGVISRNSTALGSNMAGGFNGISRSSSSSYVQRVGGVSTTLTQASQTPANDSVTILRTGAFYGSHRLSFYSIGESLDLALLDSRVSTLMTNIGAAIP